MDIPEHDRAAVRDLVIAIFRANGTVVARGDAMVGDLALSSSLWQVLGALERSPDPLTVAQVARAMGLRRQSVQRSADLLVARGLVVYAGNPAHKRASLACLTQAGREAIAAIHARELPSIAGILARIDPARVAQAARILDAFTEELGRQIEDARGE